jgi:hypothetical protein
MALTLANEGILTRLIRRATALAVTVGIGLAAYVYSQLPADPCGDHSVVGESARTAQGSIAEIEVLFGHGATRRNGDHTLTRLGVTNLRNPRAPSQDPSAPVDCSTA